MRPRVHVLVLRTRDISTFPSRKGNDWCRYCSTAIRLLVLPFFNLSVSVSLTEQSSLTLKFDWRLHSHKPKGNHATSDTDKKEARVFQTEPSMYWLNQKRMWGLRRLFQLELSGLNLNNPTVRPWHLLMTERMFDSSSFRTCIGPWVKIFQRETPCAILYAIYKYLI